ncbi:NADPH-dependent codeinone reductase 1-4-like [Arachis stenosperma]|uniref:NADPH-dependent codeinone reductase 1-4-like n=1 Tax=Arachis stenosperma TaxID=217475 RepID=UPI0025AC1D2F|nr:NADPH-dependent codeinone reductase 1-4-like [Arachis stenosperma]
MLVIGFGTAAFETDESDVHKLEVMEAIKLGYRHFDTTSIYGSEQALGEAIAEALKLGLISSRDELFITSKLWLSDNHPNLVLPALCKSLHNFSLVLLLLALTARYPSLVVVNSDPSAKTPEEALVYIFGEARRTTPSILYLPQFDVWWETARKQLRAVLQNLLDKLPSNMPIFLLETSSVVLAEVEDVPHSLFLHYSVYL